MFFFGGGGYKKPGYRLPIWIKVLMLLTFILGFVVIWLKSGR